MSQKRILYPVVIESAKSMGASFTTSAVSLQNLDRACLFIKCTGTPTGTLSVQGSADYSPANAASIAAANWADIDLSLTALAGVAQNYFIDIQVTAIPWIRINYTRVSSTGTMYAVITAKES